MLYANLRTRVKKDAIIHITRKLSGNGQILVQQGQQVIASDVIGQGYQAKGFRKISLAKLLGEPPKKATKYLNHKLGSKIYKDELLAFKPGGFLRDEKIVVSPLDGVIDYYDQSSGELQVSFLPQKVNLPAGVFGIVENVNESNGEVIIKTQATQIFGILGSGRSREGNLEIISSSGDLITSTRINSSHTGHILVGGGLVYNDAIFKAMSFGVHGIISGGINFKDYEMMSAGIKLKNRGTDIGLSVLICEGFGSIPIGEDIFEILKEHRGNFAILDGNRMVLSLPSQDSATLNRVKSVALPQKYVEGVSEEVAVEIKLGQTVRIIGSPLGQIGKVVSIDSSATLLDSGINIVLLIMEGKSRKIKVPYTNIEVINE